MTSSLINWSILHANHHIRAWYLFLPGILKSVDAEELEAGARWSDVNCFIGDVICGSIRDPSNDWLLSSRFKLAAIDCKKLATATRNQYKLQCFYSYIPPSWRASRGRRGRLGRVCSWGFPDEWKCGSDTRASLARLPTFANTHSRTPPSAPLKTMTSLQLRAGHSRGELFSGWKGEKRRVEVRLTAVANMFFHHFNLKQTKKKWTEWTRMCAANLSVFSQPKSICVKSKSWEFKWKVFHFIISG